MNLLVVSALVVFVMLLIAYAEIKREPRWNEKEKEERVQYKKAA